MNQNVGCSMDISLFDNTHCSMLERQKIINIKDLQSYLVNDIGKWT